MLTNDDGYMAPGIRKLFSVLSAHGHHVVIFAPENEQSSASRRLTGADDCVQAEKDIFYVKGGTPADTSLLALGRGRLPFQPDVVISGINNGFNVSLDLAYSGTVAAAAEAVSWGYRAIAVSAEAGSEDATEKAAAFICGNLEKLADACGEGFMLSVNVPEGASLQRWKVAVPSCRSHRGPDDFSDRALLSKAVRGSDLELLDKGYITISAIEAYPSVSVMGQKALEDMHECDS